MKNNEVIIFTDGSSRGNPGPGGWGAIVVLNGLVQELGGGEDHTTNNKMELQAAVEALRFVETQTISDATILIHTDSSYVIQGITKWIKAWVENDWVTAQDEPVVNKEEWRKLIGVVEILEENNKLTWVYLRGHVGIPGNERVDGIATAFADKKKIKLYKGSREKYSIDVQTVTASKIKKEVSLEKKERSKQKAYSYLSLVDGKLERHTTWTECEKRVKGVSGAKFKKAISPEDERTIIADWQK